MRLQSLKTRYCPQFVLPLMPIVLMMATSAQAVLIEGFAEPYRQIEIAAGEPGIITSVALQEGERASAGQELATLDTEVLVAALRVGKEKARSTGRIDAAQAELGLRRTRLEKLQTLHDKGHAMANELQRAKADVAIAEAALTAAREERRIQELECERIEAQIRRRHITSPIDGIVVEVHKEVGESILANDPRVLTLVQLHPLRVKFSVSPDQAARLKVGEKVTLKIPEAKGTEQGSVEVISAVMDAKSGTVQVSLVIENPDGRYRSGTRCILQMESPDSLAQTRSGAKTRQSKPRSRNGA